MNSFTLRCPWGGGWGGGQHEKLNAYCFVSTQLDTKDVTLTLPLPCRTHLVVHEFVHKHK